jgi:hypothetical protein
VSPAITLAGVLLTALAFPLAAYSRRFTSRRKQGCQAFSAGVAAAYVFVHVMPELEEHQRIVSRLAIGPFHAEKNIYLWALAGFVVFVGMSRLQLRTLPNVLRSNHASLVFWAEVAGYASYTLLIGYLLVHRDETTLLSLWLFVFAMLLHLFMVDNDLHEKFTSHYTTPARFLLPCGLLVGWVLGMVNALPSAFTSRMFAFVVGGVVITSAHQELPAEKGGSFCFWWFAAGAAFYSILLILI